MKRSRQQVREIKEERLRKSAIKKAVDAMRAPSAAGEIKVDANRLGPNYSVDLPDFAKRGYYLDRPFQCEDCGVQEIWTARQQKWWYETAKGGVWTGANRCRACRRRERERRAAARKVHLEGLARKERTP